MSSVLRRPGFSRTATLDDAIYRVQITGGYYLEKDLRLILEYVNDRYVVGEDVSAMIMALNARF